MATVGIQASMSLDGFIVGSNESGFEHLFAWYGNGDVEVPTADPKRPFRVSEASADYVRSMAETLGALVVGRHQFDVTQGWGGAHPSGVPVFVVTHQAPGDWHHPDAPFTFVTEGGVEAAVEQAKAVAGDRVVGVGPGDVAGQALDAGLLDEVRIDLVPVLLGEGKRLLGDLANIPVTFGTPQVIQGKGVTHLIYRVRATD
jgi:dihydrofolate reductase